MSTEKHQSIDHYIADLHQLLCKAFMEVQAQSTSKDESQRQYYDHKANAISLKPCDLVLLKADAYKGRRKVKDQWEGEPYEVEHRIAKGIPSYLMKNQETRCSWVLHWNQLLLITPIMGPCYMCMCWVDKVHHHHPGESYSEIKWEWGSTTKCKVSAACPASDKWDSSRVGQ